MKYKINKGFVSQILDGKMTILDGEKSVLYIFNETASFIFGEIKKKKDLKDIALKIAKTFNIGSKTAEADLKEFFDELIAKKIISK